MPLESKGRVVLKIYAEDGILLIARPCANQEAADKYFEEYAKSHPGVTRVEASMVPRI